MLSGFLQCCNSNQEAGAVAELRIVHLSSDVMDPHAQPQGGTPEKLSTVTPRERIVRDRIRLPKLRRYPVPPGCSADDPEEVRRAELVHTYQEFVMELHKGIHMTQLTSTQDYSDIHCQILEDLQTLKVDQGSGQIIEFPLEAVSKVYRIVKNDDKIFGAGPPGASVSYANAEHIVVVEFMRRKLAFVFNDIKVAQRFLMCMELLIRRAQECQGEEALGSTRARGQGMSGAGAIAPMFGTFGGAGGESTARKGKPLLQLDVVRKDGAGGSSAPTSSPMCSGCNQPAI